ncbi:MAG: 3-isopropylmalate dehydrogenase [Muricoprocola sp.]
MWMGEFPTAVNMVQWHPAFFTILQIELEDYADNLIFENEHQLSKKPMEIDVIVIKKERDIPVQKNIGHLFRGINIIEYKSPDDYLSIDDFYKVYGYTCFYKSDTGKADEIPADELTITMVCSKYPYKLMRHLTSKRKYTIEQVDSGIYYVLGDYFPIQIILTSQLSEENNLWLKSLTNKLDNSGSTQKLLTEYKKHKSNRLYQSAMNTIVRANTPAFQEVKDVCEALLELMKDEIDAAKNDGILQGIQANIRTCKNFNINKAATITNIMKEFSLSEEKATGYVEKYWG